MKNEDLLAILNDTEMDATSKAAKIQALNGADRTADKTKYESQIAALKQENDDYKTKQTEYEENASKYADYEELKKFKVESLAKEEKAQQVAYLKAQGAIHPELLVGQVDWSKATYNNDKSTYEGIDDAIKGLKETYKGAFKDTNYNPTQPEGGDPSHKDLTGVEKAFLANNPDLTINDIR